jgi:hypothetical protein
MKTLIAELALYENSLSKILFEKQNCNQIVVLYMYIYKKKKKKNRKRQKTTEKRTCTIYLSDTYEYGEKIICYFLTKYA